MPWTHATRSGFESSSRTESREAGGLAVWWQMLLGPAAMPAVSRSYGVEVYQPAGPPGTTLQESQNSVRRLGGQNFPWDGWAEFEQETNDLAEENCGAVAWGGMMDWCAARAAHAAVHDHNQQWADGHAPPMEDDMSLYSVQTADTNQGGGGGGGSPGRDTGEKKAGMIARIKSARPMSARKMLDAASSIGAALRTSFQNLPIPSNLPAPRQAFADPGANEPPGFQPSVSTPAPSIPNSPAVSAQPASWAAPPQPPSPPLGAAAAASSPSVSGLRDEEDAHADDVPVLATPPHVKTPRTPRPLPKETSPAPDLASGGTSETSPATEATEPKPEPAQMQAEEEATDTESMPSRPMSRLDQLEQMLNDMTARPPKRAEFKINKPTTETAIEKVEGKNAVGADAAGTEVAGAEAAGAVAAEACAVPAEAVGAPLVAEKTVVEETAEGAVVTSAGLVGEAAVGKGVDAERAEVARRVQLPAGDSQDAISSESSVGSEQARASKDASTAQANDGGTDSCTASVARAEPVDGGTPANSAQASSQARAECADGAAPAGLAGVETQPPPTAVQEPAVTTPSKPRPPSSRLSIDRPITPGPQDLLRLEQSFDSMPKLEGESEMTRRARSSFSSVASPSGSASTSLKRWQRAISFEAEVAADLAQAAAPRPKSPPAHTASSPRMQQPERQEKSPGLCSPAAVLPSPSPATVQASRPDFLDSDSDDDGTAGVPLFGSALKGSDTPSRKKKPVKQATRKLVFASGDGLASDPAGGRAQTEVVSSPPEPTEGVPRPQRSSSHQSRASASTLSTLLGPAGATSTTTKAEAVADPSIESELSGLNPEKSVLEYDEEEEDNFLRDWHKSREGRQARMDHARSYLERDSESVAVMDELRRMEAEGTGAGGAGECTLNARIERRIERRTCRTSPLSAQEFACRCTPTLTLVQRRQAALTCSPAVWAFAPQARPGCRMLPLRTPSERQPPQPSRRGSSWERCGWWAAYLYLSCHWGYSRAAPCRRCSRAPSSRCASIARSARGTPLRTPRRTPALASRRCGPAALRVTLACLPSICPQAPHALRTVRMHGHPPRTPNPGCGAIVYDTCVII
jgi:hypothetical protein